MCEKICKTWNRVILVTIIDNYVLFGSLFDHSHMTGNINLKFNVLIMRLAFELITPVNGVNRAIDKDANNGIWTESNTVYKPCVTLFSQQIWFCLVFAIGSGAFISWFVYCKSISSGSIRTPNCWWNHRLSHKHSCVRCTFRIWRQFKRFVCKL